MKLFSPGEALLLSSIGVLFFFNQQIVLKMKVVPGGQFK